MKNLRVFLKDKKFLIYFILIPILIIALANFYSVKKLENDMKPVRVGIVVDDALKADENMVNALVGIAKNATYKDKVFIKYETYEGLEKAEDALGKNNIDMYLKLQKRDSNKINKKLEAYTVGDEKKLKNEDFGEGIKITLKANKVNRNTKLFKTYVETIAKDENLQKYVATRLTQKELMSKIEENQYKKVVMAGMPFQFLLDLNNKTYFMELGNKIEDKYIKHINEFLKENTKDVEKINKYMKEFQKFQYKGAKEKSLKQNIPTTEQIEQIEKAAKHNDHHSMMVADAKENKKIEEELKNKKEEEEKQKQKLEAQNKIQKEQADQQEKIANQIFFKLDNANRIYILLVSFSIIVFIQGIYNIRYFTKKDKLQSMKQDSLKNVKTFKTFRKHNLDIITAFFINLLFAYIIYFVFVSILKISAGVYAYGKMDILKSLKDDIYNYFEFNTIYLSLGMIFIYTLITTTLSYLVYILAYNKKLKTKQIIYAVLGVVIFVFGNLLAAYINNISIYLSRINISYLFTNGMYLLRFNGVNALSISNLIVLGIIYILLALVSIVAFICRIKKIKKEEKEILEVEND